MELLAAVTGTLRISFGLIFFVIVALATIVTLVNVIKTLSLHNARTRMLRQRAEEKIRRQTLVSMLVKISGAMLWTRKNGMFYLDKAMQDFLGLDTNVVEFSDSILKNSAETQRKLRDFFHNTKPGEYYLQVYGRMYDKEPHWYALHMYIEEAADGIVSHGITMIIDSLKRQEEQAMETQRMLVSAKERGEFLANMSHQIRTPLNVIMGFTQLLCEPETKLSSEDVQLYGNEIAYNNSRLMKIIDDVLTMTLIGNSNIKVSLENHRLSEFMDFSQRDTVSTLLKKYSATVKVKENLEDYAVIVDSLFICRVIDNLIDNAVLASASDSTNKQGNDITVMIDWHKNDDGTVTLDVIDHGCGIPEDQKEKIFERFYRIDKYGEGVGLGLPLSKSLIEKMGGSISVESTVDKGSTFSITMKSGE